MRAKIDGQRLTIDVDNVYHIGLSCTYHDPALAVVGPDGRVLFAEATERHTGSKHAFPYQPMAGCGSSTLSSGIVTRMPPSECL